MKTVEIQNKSTMFLLMFLKKVVHVIDTHVVERTKRKEEKGGGGCWEGGTDCWEG